MPTPILDFDALAQAISGRTVLCIGDIMLDEFVYGEVSRISPEAPAPVIAAQRSEIHVGGAGNVARNVASLGARCIFVGLVGEDEAGARLKAALDELAAIESVLVRDASRPLARREIARDRRERSRTTEKGAHHSRASDARRRSPARRDVRRRGGPVLRDGRLANRRRGNQPASRRS